MLFPSILIFHSVRLLRDVSFFIPYEQPYVYRVSVSGANWT